jgi:23S rRNA (pseudouridine1915-N3)-methyltransferase
MKKLRFIWIGKLKKKFWQDAAQHYWQRLEKYYSLEEICLKDGPAQLEAAERIEAEGQNISKKISPKDLLITLDEKGRTLSSPALANKLQNWLEEPSTSPCFVIGGAFGLSSAIKQKSQFILSLGPLTLPHDLARIVLLEQIYRAATINLGLPYHHC